MRPYVMSDENNNIIKSQIGLYVVNNNTEPLHMLQPADINQELNKYIITNFYQTRLKTNLPLTPM